MLTWSIIPSADVWISSRTLWMFKKCFKKECSFAVMTQKNIYIFTEDIIKKAATNYCQFWHFHSLKEKCKEQSILN